ncbi:penicillin-binding protein 2 [Candidatus Saccharibacteria bacterium]|nr:penicillin-binding protein 2 [Candidatus Saccharibacteria bacterium]
MDSHPFTSSIRRINVMYLLLVGVVVLFGLRLFYLQVIRHNYYEKQALTSQLKQYEIPADRGSIYAYDGDEIVPLVLNETRYRIVADPELVDDSAQTAIALSGVIGRSAEDIQKQLEADSRYEILANKQTKEVKEKIDNLKLPGIFTNEKVPQRVYIQGAIAGQILGFVNDAGEGNYGIEQFFDDDLNGTPGRVKALTDKNNVPLLATSDNVLIDPIDGEDIVLTLDVAMQRQLEAILAQGLKNAISKSGSAIILDARNGAVKAMANYPTYDPAKFSSVEDPKVFNNASVSEPLEPGSVMKTLTAAAALDTGSVGADQTYFDPSFFRVDDATVRNIEEDGGAATRSVSDILQFSLNTGATWLLMQMGGGELNEQGRKTWYDYMTNHYNFGSPTGIEQGFEAEGIIPSPTEGFGLNIRYANTAFGQGMTVTPLQMAAAVTAAVNGGTYYRPTLISGTLDSDGSLRANKPDIKHAGVVKESTSKTLVRYMDNVVEKNNRPAAREGYRVGGKTGTAEIANPEGGYYEDKFNGTYVGYVGGDTPEYVIMVRVDEPKVAGYAGSRAAGPIFASLSNMLIDNFTVSRKSN